MDSTRRKIIVFGALAPIGFIGGCKNLSPDSNREVYKENFSSIYVTEDKETLVVVGDRFHYVFDADPIIVSTLYSSYHPYTSATFSNFHVNEKNEVSGFFGIYLDAHAGDEALRQARKDGYVQLLDGWGYKGGISGKRYRADSTFKVSTENRLNQAYSIDITQVKSRAPESPLKKGVGDAVMLGLSPVIFVGFFSVYFLKCTKANIKGKSCQL